MARNALPHAVRPGRAPGPLLRNAAAAVALGVLLLAGAWTAWSPGPAQHGTAPGPHPSTAAAGPHPSTAAGTGAGAGSPAGPGAVGTALSAWLQAGGQGVVSALSSDTARLSHDLQDGPGTVAADCTQLAADAHRAQGYRPVPDPLAQDSWSHALTAIRSGAATCSTAATQDNPDGVYQGIRQIAAGTQDVQATATRLTRLLARPR